MPDSTRPPVPPRQIRAVYTEDTITVYQAFNPDIADRAVARQRFVKPFSRGRMTWIKPSFLWMMYRSGWAAKEGQERVLAVDITRAGFEWALANSCLSHYDGDAHASRDTWQELVRSSPVRIQWDPERDPALRPLPHRSLQIGLGGPAVDRYVDEWTTAIADITGEVRAEHAKIRVDGGVPARTAAERPYPLPAELAVHIGASG